MEKWKKNQTKILYLIIAILLATVLYQSKMIQVTSEKNFICFTHNFFDVDNLE